MIRTAGQRVATATPVRSGIRTSSDKHGSGPR